MLVGALVYTSEQTKKRVRFKKKVKRERERDERQTHADIHDGVCQVKHSSTAQMNEVSTTKHRSYEAKMAAAVGEERKNKCGDEAESTGRRKEEKQAARQ